MKETARALRPLRLSRMVSESLGFFPTRISPSNIPAIGSGDDVSCPPRISGG